MRQFETVELNSDMINFLKEYSPEEKHITSLKEIRLIEDKLNIDNYRNNLRALRNSVVQFYDELIDEDLNNRAKNIVDELEEFIKKEQPTLF